MRRLILLSAAALAACARGQPEPDAAARPEALASSLQVDVAADSVRFTLHVTNISATPIELDFPSAQRYDFAVQAPGGAEVWRWSAGRAFAQVVGSVVVAPGETLTFDAAWQPPRGAGEFVAIGELAASNVAVARDARFHLLQ